MAFTNRISTRQSDTALTFSIPYPDNDLYQFAINAQTNVTAYGDVPYTSGYFDDGGTDDYSCNFMTQDGDMILYHPDPAIPYASNPIPICIRGKFMVSRYFSIYNPSWDLMLTDVPTDYAVGSYDQGAYGTTLSVPTTNPVANPDDTNQSYFFPWISFDGSNPSIGSFFIDADQPFSIWALKNGAPDDGAYQAFEMNDYVGFINVKSLPTWSDGTSFYTWATYDDSGLSPNNIQQFLSVWTPETTGFNYTNYHIELSDAGDDAIFQSYRNTTPDPTYVQITCNTRHIILTFWDPTVSTATAFVFNTDMTEYDKYTFDVDNVNYAYPTFFIDIATGAKWLIMRPVTGDSATFVIPASPTPSTSGTEIASLTGANIYRLPCFTPCIPHTIKEI